MCECFDMWFVNKKYSIKKENVRSGNNNYSVTCKYILIAGYNPLIAKLFNLNFHPLEVVSR